MNNLRERWNALSRPAQWAILVPLVVLIYFLPVLNPPILATTGTDFPTAMFDVARYALVAIGLNVVVGQAGLLDLGYVGFFAVGAYVAALFTSPNSSLHKLPYLWTLPLAMVVTMVFGVILGTPTLRLRGDYLAIVTLGFGEIIRLIADNVAPLRGQSGFQAVATDNQGTPFFGNATQWYWLTVTIIIGILLLVGNLERSRVGRAWVAIREDEDVAEIMGVATYKFKIWAFVIGAAIGGLSGALYAGKVGFVNNQSFDVVTSMLFLAAVVLGGAGNKVGVMLGAVVVAYLPLRFVQIAEYNYLIFGIALIVLMIFRPQGLLGARQRLLAKGRQAYQRLIGRPEQLSGDSALASEPGGTR
ncbi:branched-chain amino acid transport system permease protein [Amycolatopsis bartoniae]|uniref:Branched-chain amino acid ABC transporter permease n=1 Tax=Amycolatopsis bartoniae TaxID=941986 RepID=A0A8H9M4T2_9PSEU|nr:branched-chain amino acid ABC transporter permease [Amycolatopsis bartoniae]MBB2936876.1 branched-chain amino acid transport system permease protein [Amycolatopsis bartoniae]TVT07249.1 branched-chain amino acid ABC transporter permease [Amycolatopsis bartoniae]GHF50837.1 branched-chain amino acid ABC transporter permease [Amycolatopsis bartoniae]